MIHRFRFLSAVVSVCAFPAQSEYVPVNSPYAQSLVVAVKGAHPELQKLGLHAIAPGLQDYAIVGNNFPSKIGKKSSLADLAVLRSGKPSVKDNVRGGFFDLCLPLSDAQGRAVGIAVMEIPHAFANSSAEALVKATVVRDELRARIPGNAQLFEASVSPLK